MAALVTRPGPGFEIGGYRITGWLGHGAMAEVYEAVDDTGHVVALKVFRAGSGMSTTMLERFRREAEATKKLRRHPYILTVYATGNDGEFHYIAMERVPDSRTLETLVGVGAPIPELLRIFIKIANALQFAHEHQIIHRDVKPSNIMLEEHNEPLLADFGVAELVDWPSCTISGALTGTPMYMAPEQARSDRVTPATDVYSLAVVLYEVLTGCLPYDLPEAPSTEVILDAVKNRDPIPARRRSRRISKALEYVLNKALKKNLAERYADMREFQRDMEAVLEGRQVMGRWLLPFQGTRYWFRRNRTLLAGSLAFLLLAFASYRGSMQRLHRERHQNLILRATNASTQKKYAASSTTRRTEQEMRLARMAMEAGKWFDARDQLQQAVDVNLRLGLAPSLVEAQVELARCEVMLHNSLKAHELYQSVIANSASPPGLVQAAALERMILLVLNADRAAAREVLARLPGDEVNPYTRCARILMGERPDAAAETFADSRSARFRVYAAIAMVLRSWESTPPAERLRLLQRIQKDVPSPVEWPAPLINYLKDRAHG